MPQVTREEIALVDGLIRDLVMYYRAKSEGSRSERVREGSADLASRYQELRGRVRPILEEHIKEEESSG